MLNKKNMIATAIILVGVGAFLLSNIRTANTQTSKKANDITQEKDIPDRDFPMVSLEAPNKSKSIDEKRSKKGEKFDNLDWVKKTINEEVTAVNRITHWQIGLPLLPTQKSNVVVIGTVNSGEAFLSNDETGIYSEFTVKISSLIKNNQNKPLELNSEIAVQREGGRIAYPSGKILRYSILGQEMPRLNGRYVFFLGYDQPRQVYSILTAYEILNDKIIALDGRGLNSNGTFKFSKYDGMNEQQFMDEIQTALYSQTDSSKGVTIP